MGRVVLEEAAKESHVLAHVLGPILAPTPPNPLPEAALGDELAPGCRPGPPAVPHSVRVSRGVRSSSRRGSTVRSARLMRLTPISMRATASVGPDRRVMARIRASSPTRLAGLVTSRSVPATSTWAQSELPARPDRTMIRTVVQSLRRPMTSTPDLSSRPRSSTTRSGEAVAPAWRAAPAPWAADPRGGGGRSGRYAVPEAGWFRRRRPAPRVSCAVASVVEAAFGSAALTPAPWCGRDHSWICSASSVVPVLSQDGAGVQPSRGW